MSPQNKRYTTIFQTLENWFKKSARKLPWREDRSLWSVMLSEVMLQQTQVATVLKYYKQWMKRYPSYLDFAADSEENIMKMWEGLGYYRRVKALYKAAQVIKEKGMPKSQNELLKLPGIGPYTAAAIASFSFNERSAPVDGNVLRVMMRLEGREDDISKASTAKFLRSHLLDILPTQNSHIASEALIELGATICKKEPLCSKCPLESYCQARKRGIEKQLPIKSKLIKVEKLVRDVAVINSKEKGWLVAQKLSKGVFEGMWHFPYLERDDESVVDFSVQEAAFEEFLDLPLHYQSHLNELKHSFTRFLVTLRPICFETSSKKTPQASRTWLFQWACQEKLKKLTFVSGHRSLRDQILRN